MSDSVVPPEVLDESFARYWQQWQERVADENLQVDFSDDFVSTLKRVWEGSDYVSQHCVRNPRLLIELQLSGELERTFADGELAEKLTAELAEVMDETELHRLLRLFRQRQMVRIIWRDLGGLAELDEILEDLSALADACIDQALMLLTRWAEAKQGVPRDADGRAQRLVVLGMGKLGARELNLSSDIDLIFTYPAKGNVDGPRPIANEQFFFRLCQQLVKALNSQTVDGFVFRVDTRLRPFGESGPLAVNFDAMEGYYQQHAREWERYAMIKARVVAGDQKAGEQLMALLRPFVYRRYLDYGAFESLRKLKRLIMQELHRKGMDRNIKLGAGGIREIEFIGQAFQLIRGGRDPELQIRGIQPVLHHLAVKGLLPAYVEQELQSAYRFLRLTENRIQAWKDQQTHLLPEDEVGKLRLARSMGYSDWKGFAECLDGYRQRVQGHFDQVFAAPQAEEESEVHPLAQVWESALDGDELQDLLRGAGYQDPLAVQEQLMKLRNSHAFRGIGERGMVRLDRLMPMLLDACGKVEQPEETLRRLLTLVEKVSRRTAYLALLVENPLALSQLVRLAAISPWITELLQHHPLLMDELLDPRRLFSPLRKGDLLPELNSLMAGLPEDDLEQQMERLRQFAKSNVLRVASADLTGIIPLMVVSDYLTDIAEVVVDRVMRIVWNYLVAKHGRPTNILGEDSGFAVIGYGKLGGYELGYGSDLDLVFIHGSRRSSAMTDGDHAIANDLFYARMGQRMIHMFTTRTASGQLYEIDMRLRPNGNSGLLVTSLDAFERYQKNDAWVWEHQALLRARAVAGDPAVIERFEQGRRDVLSQHRDPEQLRFEVVKMRERMRDTLDKSGRGQFDIKQGRGGIADIEFMVQYSALRWAKNAPEILQWTDNIRLLEILQKLQLLDEQMAVTLADCYRALRGAYHRNALSELPGLIDDQQLCNERQQVESIWQRLMLG